MCEADKDQFLDAEFTAEVEGLWGKLRVVVNACGADADNFTYPVRTKLVAFSPYYQGGRDRQLTSAAMGCQTAWLDGDGAGFHCNNTSHRGPLACIATFVKASHCDTRDRMSNF